MYIYRVCECNLEGEYDIGYYKKEESAIKRLKEQVEAEGNEFSDSNLSRDDRGLYYMIGMFSSIEIFKVKLEA